MKKAAAIEFKNVIKRYGDTEVVKNVSFTIEAGSLVTLLGPSGCGKTTTLRMIAGLEQPSAGQVWIGDKDVTLLPPLARNVSMMFQSYALFPHMKVVDNVAYGLLNQGLKKKEAAERALEALEQVGLGHLGHRWPSELSGGQQQRVALARALVMEPSVLLFDEPLSNLDARLRRQMREEIRALQQRLGITAVYVTHDQNEALAVSDQIIVMNVGVIAQQGTPQKLYQEPNSEFVAGFMGEANLLSVDKHADGYRLGSLALTHATGEKNAAQKVAVRPEAIQIKAANQPNTLPATVLKATYLGMMWEVELQTEVGNLFAVSADVLMPYRAGDAVGVGLADYGVSLIA
ncbi:MAG: ABC transporter ATP-binding protein [Formosimonas sp.]